MKIPAALVVVFLTVHGFAAAQKSPDTGSVQGAVTASSSRIPLASAAVTVIGTSMGAVTDERGRYHIDRIPAGTYNIRFSLVGYTAMVKTDIAVNPGRVAELSVALDEEPVAMESVTSTATESYFEKDPEAEVSGRTMDTEEIVTAPGSWMDVQRVVQVLPSVTSGADMMNEIIVRGGNYGENLFVMDGIEIPNPNHFAFQGAGGGPISILRSEFINDVSFLAGAFPARFGDKASSVMDIALRNGNREKHLKTIDTGMAGLGTMMEGPLGKSGSYLFSARKSFLDLIISNTGLTAIPRLQNMQAKITRSFGSNHTLLWNTVFGNDSIRIRPGEDTDDTDNQNAEESTSLFVTGLTLKSTFGQNLYGEGVLSHVRNHWATDVWEEGTTRSDDLFNNRSLEAETTLKYDLTLLLGRHELSGGISLKNSRFDHDIFSEPDTVFTWDTSFATAREDTATGIYRIYPAWRDDHKVNTLKSAAYGQIRLSPTDRLTLRIGERWDHLAYTGHGTLTPRIGIRYRLADTLWLNGAYGVHSQSPSYIELTSHPDNRDLDYYRTRQKVAGIEWIPRPDTRITLEAYTKRYSGVPVPKEWTTPDPWDSFEGRMVNAAKGHTEGIELFLHRKMSTSFMYILSYSHSRAFFTDPRTNVERPWDFDNRNLFTLSAAKKWRPGETNWYPAIRKKLWYKLTGWLLPFGDEVMLSGKWRFAGGRPYTEPEYLREYHVWIEPADVPFNTKRLADYHRLDLRLDRRFYRKDRSYVVYIDVMNVYGRDNIWDYSRDKYGKVERVSQFSTMPVGGFTMEF
jgi:hypothetical protein